MSQSTPRPTYAPVSRKRADWLIARRVWSDLAEAAGYAKGVLLDVGCGEKQYSHLFREMVTQYVGLDLHPTRECKADFCADAVQIPCADATFDTVLSSQVLEHLPKPWKAMAEMARVLKPGGHLIITAPRIWFLHHIPHDYYRFTEYGLRHLAESSGLQIVLLRRQGGMWEMIGQQITSYLSYTFGRTPHSPSARLALLSSLLVSQLAVWADHFGVDPLVTINYLMVARKAEVSE